MQTFIQLLNVAFLIIMIYIKSQGHHTSLHTEQIVNQYIPQVRNE